MSCPVKRHIGIEREVGDRERADGVEGPGGEAFHETSEAVVARLCAQNAF